MTVKRMDNVGIVVEDLDAAIAFFEELGLELEGRAPIEGAWADGVTGLRDMRVEIAMMCTPDGHSRLELSRFLAPTVVADRRVAITDAVASAGSDDIVLVAGKGHEQGQIFADRVVPFDDRDVVRAALAARHDEAAP